MVEDDFNDQDLANAIPQFSPEEDRALSVAENWMGEGIQGVGIGRTGADQPCVVVYATDPTAAAVRHLPSTCEGLPVRVITTDTFHAQ